MAEPDMTLGPFIGQVREDLRTPAVLDVLGRLDGRIAESGVERISCGRNRIVRITLPTGPQGPALPVAVKCFGRSCLAGGVPARLRTSKARRTWRAAVALRQCGVGTPAPVAFLERWSGLRLVESYFVSEYAAGLSSFKRELVRLFREQPDCDRFMQLMQTVAGAVRSMHDAGFQHNDLGNQNIGLRDEGCAPWSDVVFFDLNRGRVRKALTPRQRARDLSRIYLPSDLLRVFKEMYWGTVPPGAFVRWERVYRLLYAVHSATRPLRHPVRALLKDETEAASDRYPPEQDMWIWDERSAQAIAVLRSGDRWRFRSPRSGLMIARALLASGPLVGAAARRLRSACFRHPVALDDRVGVAMEPSRANLERQLELLRDLGRIPVLIRFYFHRGRDDVVFRMNVVRRLAGDGHAVAVALVQNREAVLFPGRFADFARSVLRGTADCADWFELGHAVNRVKWGVWNVPEYARLMEALSPVLAAYPSARFAGPAAIDFEYPFVLAALRRLPAGIRLWALSHHLYVDRRGAPEKRQGKFTALDKFVLARAMANVHSACAGRVMVSEVNWPILGTGVYSPVNSPYLSPGARRNDPSVSEDEYADFMLRYLLIALCSGMVDRVYWWRLVARGFGLVDDSDAGAWRLRPAYTMLREFLRAARGGRFVEKPACGRGVEAFVIERAGARTALAYTPGDALHARLPFAFDRCRDALGRPATVTPDGIRLSGRPVYLRLCS